MNTVHYISVESIAVFGEVTADPVLKRILHMMQKDPEGVAILRDKPRINSSTIDLDWLASLPKDTLGKPYSGVKVLIILPVALSCSRSNNQVANTSNF